MPSFFIILSFWQFQGSRELTLAAWKKSCGDIPSRSEVEGLTKPRFINSSRSAWILGACIFGCPVSLYLYIGLVPVMTSSSEKTWSVIFTMHSPAWMEYDSHWDQPMVPWLSVQHMFTSPFCRFVTKNWYYISIANYLLLLPDFRIWRGIFTTSNIYLFFRKALFTITLFSKIVLSPFFFSKRFPSLKSNLSCLNPFPYLEWLLLQS